MTKRPTFSFFRRKLTRRGVVAGGLGLAAIPLLQACAPQATPTAIAPPTLVPAAPPPTPTAAAAATPAATAAMTPTGAATAAATAAMTPTAAATAAAKPATTPAGTPAVGATPAAKAPALAKVGGSVSVLAVWGGDEEAAFRDMVRPFEEQTGATIEYEGTRDLNAVLTTRIEGGNPPDVAGLPGPGQMAELGRAGHLIDLTGVLDMNQMGQWYSEDWMKLAQVENRQVGIFIKAALKGLIWHSPPALQQANIQMPNTWDDMLRISTEIADGGTAPWSIGLESGAASGWPGTDWIESILLRQAGPDVYDRWHEGQVRWTSGEVRAAWEEWGKIVGEEKMVFGGRQGVLSRAFGDAADPLFQSPPQAFFHHQANFMSSFIEGNFPNAQAGQDFDVFVFPDINTQHAGAVESAGDLFGMFKDTPPARELMKWLVTPQAQQIWVQKGGALSPNKAVPESAYPDAVARKAGQILSGAQIVRFDGSDLMPEAMNNAFWRAILDYVNNPGNLDSILQELDRVQADAYEQR